MLSSREALRFLDESPETVDGSAPSTRVQEEPIHTREPHYGAPPARVEDQHKQATLKRLMTAESTVAIISKLEMGGEPVWGLSQRERGLVKEAREMLNVA
mmetsp:Transcript_7258/g.21420  ORF Transcript_7258/g.21420 Transcript_7258/m.21420 type:complete len:100 (+) Transcript_7258:483-782(+)